MNQEVHNMSFSLVKNTKKVLTIVENEDSVGELFVPFYNENQMAPISFEQVHYLFKNFAQLPSVLSKDKYKSISNINELIDVADDVSIAVCEKVAPKDLDEKRLQLVQLFEKLKKVSEESHEESK